jgi:DNA invertase Pin-like site-specific DNA recombinase
MSKFVAYYRVSTQQQGRSGLGLDAQRDAVTRFLAGRTLIAEFEEVESGARADRLQLKAAMERCRQYGAVLVFAKLDRLARDTKLVLDIADAGVPVVFCDFPDIPEGAAGRFLLTMLASVAEFERRRISERTKAALAAARSRGVSLGVRGPSNLRPNIERRQKLADDFVGRLRGVFDGMRARALSQRAMVVELNDARIAAPRGGPWTLVQVQRALHRLGALARSHQHDVSRLTGLSRSGPIAPP